MTASTTKVSNIGFVVMSTIVATKSSTSTVHTKVAVSYVLLATLTTVTARCGNR